MSLKTSKRPKSPDTEVWRVFYTRARAEKKAEQRLEDRRIEVLVPKKTEVRQWSDRKKEVTEPLFRNYLFARVGEKDRIRVLRTNGIVRCVHFDGKPAQLREDTAQRLKKIQAVPDRLSTADLRPQVGSTVTITDGPERLHGLTGEVLEHRGRTYVLLRVKAVRQAVKVEVNAKWVEEAEETAQRA
ncbi:transcription termination/antitermination protein NusG [Salinibacter ruber]|uniref:transcription termination/antitermination protein NusG n=1 Tax=Salinibacter ruber TaxID=146919 RepID=UPI0021670AB2|nr:UpxY family transcription antiterminator [Salinibacter ruber]MCS4197174.1 transcription antitermination factor NusG [Salinibacter ruber]